MMRRILVPLDGSRFSETILPDARLLGGPGGSLVLLYVWIRAGPEHGHPSALHDTRRDEAGNAYMRLLAARLTEQGVKAEPHCLGAADVASAVDSAAREYFVDMIACATHGPGLLSRLGISGIAWRALAHSPVPVLLRHVDEDSLPLESKDLNGRQAIMVPLDGSTFAEGALQVADDLGRDWNAPILLTQVVPLLPFATAADGTSSHEIVRQEIIRARAYLQELAEWFSCPVQTRVLVAHSVTDALVQLVARARVTHVILSSHGRSGLSRVILGSVTSRLISRLRCAVIVVPATALEDTRASLELASMTPGIS